MKTKAKAFTLIEMLVVLIIIAILTGLTFHVFSLVTHKAAVTTTTYELQQIQNAINEYYSEYGYYPPVNGNAKDNIEYEYENCSSNTQSVWFRDVFLPQHNDPSITNSTDPNCFFGDKDRPFPQLGFTPQQGWNLNYRYGLVSHLYQRDQGSQKHWYDVDTIRDSSAKRKWNHFIDDICLPPDVYRNGSQSHSTPPGLQTQTPYTNSIFTLRDRWLNNYRYVSRPSFTRYMLWSAGPDGVDGTSDDINASTE